MWPGFRRHFEAYWPSGDGSSAIPVQSSPASRGAGWSSSIAKRLFDVASAALALPLLTPLFFVIAVLVKLDSAGPVFYRSPRIGKDGRTFGMIKFRTMVADADGRGPLVTAADDPRITKTGRFLRRNKLDELPTLINVVRGEMSIVGPRPENPVAAALYTAEQRRVWSVRPGITSLATVRYRDEELMLAGVPNLDDAYYAIMQKKLRIELAYIAERRFSTDLVVVWRTVQAIISNRSHA
jgi:lipopolysaccharide/colanic/teichoic acid biosynthesis glycosyltransferase